MTKYLDKNGVTTLWNKVKAKDGTVLSTAKTYADEIGAKKQDKLTAGDNITINNNVISASGGSSYNISIASGSYGEIIGGTKIMEGSTQEVIIKKPADTSYWRYVLPTDVTKITCTNSILVKVDTNLIDADSFALHITAPSSNISINTGIEQLSAASKGDIIYMNLGNTETPTWGTLHQYRVLKNIDGNKWLVMAMYTSKSSAFGSSQTYSGSTLDTYCNTTWYNTLSDKAKAAIVDQTISQYTYKSGTVTDSHCSYADYSSKTLVESMSRHCYALDVEDIEEYFGGTAGSASAKTQGTFTRKQLLKLFFNTETTLAKHVWLRSANSSNSNNCWNVNGNNGNVNNNNYTNSNGVRVDLVNIFCTARLHFKSAECYYLQREWYSF